MTLLLEVSEMGVSLEEIFNMSQTRILDSLPPLYRLIKDSGYGLSLDNKMYVGLCFRRVSDPIFQDDFLEEEFSMIGTEADIRFPDGLQENAVYEPVVHVTGRDWETGYADDWCIQMVKVMN